LQGQGQHADQEVLGEQLGLDLAERLPGHVLEHDCMGSTRLLTDGAIELLRTFLTISKMVAGVSIHHPPF